MGMLKKVVDMSVFLGYFEKEARGRSGDLKICHRENVWIGGRKKMENARYQMEWPREGLVIRCFAHDIMNYRYHWHPDEYELNILLNGSQEYCRGTQNVLLEEGDVVLTAPGVGHGSFGQQANTTAVVLHFSASAVRPLLKKGGIYHFPTCLSDAQTRDEKRYRRVRFYASQIFEAMRQGGSYAQLTARSSLELLLITLCTEFDPQQLNEMPEDEQRRNSIRRVLAYVEQHYAEKLTLEQLADYAQYNRTYISTLFKQMVGVNFHEYLTRVRFQHALNDLALTRDGVTEIALRNGFADLKTFNARFRATLHRTPAEYRAQLSTDRVMRADDRKFLSSEDPILCAKLQDYLQVGG